MPGITLELDFFGVEKESSSKSQVQKLFGGGRSFRGIERAISKLNRFLKSVIASGSVKGISSENGGSFASKKSHSVPSSPEEDQNLSSAASPVSSPNFSPPETAPLTIVYNTVSVYNGSVPRDKAETIMKLAVEGSSKTVGLADPKLGISSSDQRQQLEMLNGAMPIARRVPMQRFIEKRKQRLTLGNTCPDQKKTAEQWRSQHFS